MRSRTVWEEGERPGTQVVAAAVVVSMLAMLLDLALGGGLGLLFDLVLVPLCVGCALLVRPRDFFAVGVLPPLLLLAELVLLAIVHRPAIAEPDDGAVQAVVSGLSHHALALGIGYGLCLAVLGVRDRIARGLLRPGGLTRATTVVEARTGVVVGGRRRRREAHAPNPHPGDTTASASSGRRAAGRRWARPL